MSQTLQHIFEAASDCILLVNKKSQVVFANTAARRENLVTSENTVIHAIGSLINAPQPHTSTSIQIELSQDGNQRCLDISLIKMEQLLAIVAKVVQAENHHDVRESHLQTGLQQEIASPLRTFITELRDHEKNTQQTAQQQPPANDNMITAAEVLSSALDDLLHLIEISDSTPLARDERIATQDLLSEITSWTAQQHPGTSLVVRVAPSSAKIGVVYGNRFWLTMALRTCVTSMIRSNKTKNTIFLSCHQHGNFANFHLLNNGYLQPGNTHPSDDAGTASNHNQDTSSQIGFRLAKRIVELHHGHIRQLGHGSTLEILLDLPTGAPVESRNELNTAQVIRYAKDIATLFSRQIAKPVHRNQKIRPYAKQLS